MQRLLSREQVRLIDSLAVSRYGIPSVVLMENAGRNAAEVIEREFGPARRAIILCGEGNNGGDGFVIARHLHNQGWSVELAVLGDEHRMSDETRTNFQICTRMNLPMVSGGRNAIDKLNVVRLASQDVLVDALLGTGFSGAVRSPMAELILAANAIPWRAVVAVDVPSGLDCDTGQPSNATIRADLTISFVAGKRGFGEGAAMSCVGRVVVADIGAPVELITEIAERKSASAN